MSRVAQKGAPPSHGGTCRAPARSLVDWFEEGSRRDPERVAVRCGNESASYAELDHRSAQVAAMLLRRGAHPGCVVPVHLPRSIDLVVGVLGVLRAGCAYVPLDPLYPGARQAAVTADTGSRLVLSTRRARFPVDSEALELPIEAVAIEDAATARVSTVPSPKADDLAYVIYTSGSTGEPKGVAVEHGSVVKVLEAFAAITCIKPTDLLLGVTSLLFDIATLELFLPLGVGATLALAEHDPGRDPDALLDEIARLSPTVMQATPTLWRMLTLLGEWRAPNLTVLCGGEQLQEDLAHELLDRCGRLFNVYGPTETTIWSTVDEVTPGAEPIVTIGRAIEGTRLAIDMGSRWEFGPDRGSSSPETATTPGRDVGELLIAGAGLARGYWHRDAQTAERFVYRDDTRWYRTGDLARWLPDGRVEWIGRNDQQVKVRGYRVELGAIEATLRSHEAVADAAVTCAEGGRLIAVLLPTNKALAPPDEDELKTFIGSTLPSYMVPSLVRWVERMPLTPTGKIDRRSLLEPDDPGVAGLAADERDAAARCTRMLVQHLAVHLAISAESIDLDAPVFGVDGPAIGPIVLDSMEFVELIVDLEGKLGHAILPHFDSIADVSIAAIGAKIATIPGARS